METTLITDVKASYRNQTIDAMKGIAIILVVLGHLMSPRSSYIYAFHMPLFFFLSGYLYVMKDIRSFTVHKLRTIGIPILFFNALYLLIYINHGGG